MTCVISSLPLPTCTHGTFFLAITSSVNSKYSPLLAASLPASQPPGSYASNFSQNALNKTDEIITLYLQHSIVHRIKSRVLSKTNKVLHGLATAGLFLSFFPLDAPFPAVLASLTAFYFFKSIPRCNCHHHLLSI